MDYTINDIIKELRGDCNVDISKWALIKHLTHNFIEDQDYRKSYIYIIPQRTKDQIIEHYRHGKKPKH
jgi:hypothetical protein